MAVSGGFATGNPGGGLVSGGTGGFREEDHPRDSHGQFAPGGGSATPETGGGEEPELKEKVLSPDVQAELDKQGGRRIGAAEQRYAEEHNEAHLAGEMENQNFHALPIPDEAPEDIRLHENGQIVGGIELKTMLFNKAGQLRMKADAIQRKKDWQAQHQAQMHTVVYDDREAFNANGEGQHDESKREIYYRRGCANFQVKETMLKVRDMTHLAELLRMSDEDLPARAKPPKDWPKVNKVAKEPGK